MTPPYFDATSEQKMIPIKFQKPYQSFASQASQMMPQSVVTNPSYRMESQDLCNVYYNKGLNMPQMSDDGDRMSEFSQMPVFSQNCISQFPCSPQQDYGYTNEFMTSQPYLSNASMNTFPINSQNCSPIPPWLVLVKTENIEVRLLKTGKLREETFKLIKLVQELLFECRIRDAIEIILYMTQNNYIKYVYKGKQEGGLEFLIDYLSENQV